MDDQVQIRPFGQSLPMALLRAREASMRLFRPMLAANGLTEQQWRVLRALVSSDTPMEVSVIAERTFLLGPSLSRILANLTDRGYIRRESDARDHRRSQVSISPEGLALVRRVAPLAEDIYSAIERQFGTDRLSDLMVLLADMAQLRVEQSPSAAASNGDV